MLGRIREEDEADLWLREHDPYYTDARSNKTDSISNPYETPKQEVRRKTVEIPFSSLSVTQMEEIGMEIKGSDGEYTGSL